MKIDWKSSIKKPVPFFQNTNKHILLCVPDTKQLYNLFIFCMFINSIWFVTFISHSLYFLVKELVRINWFVILVCSRLIGWLCTVYIIQVTNNCPNSFVNQHITFCINISIMWFFLLNINIYIYIYIENIRQTVQIRTHGRSWKNIIFIRSFNR